MSTRLRTARLRIPVESGAIQDRSRGTTWLCRLIQIALALYLIPALLVVLVVGGIGMVVLAIARLLTTILGKSAGQEQSPIGPAPPSSKT
ncbi:MAG TPA: hypothetical protein VFF52_15050 [Isosphaeraceae bacterium]|nr:hypothetical protein [Isosphaeraceae bacterium]